jgi:hypothetical protein
MPREADTDLPDRESTIGLINLLRKLVWMDVASIGPGADTSQLLLDHRQLLAIRLQRASLSRSAGGGRFDDERI